MIRVEVRGMKHKKLGLGGGGGTSMLFHENHVVEKKSKKIRLTYLDGED